MKTPHPRNRLSRVLFWACLAVLGVTILYPTGRLLLQAAMQWRSSALAHPALPNTILLSFLSVLTSGLVGTALAFLFTRYEFPGRNAAAAFAYLPFALPPLVGVLSFWYIIGRDGFVSRFAAQHLGLQWDYVQGLAPVLLIHTYSFYIFFYAMVSSALESMDPSQAEAARTLGASPWRVFTRVTVPALRPALVGASLLTFMSSGASFSAPLFFGGDFRVLSVQIFQERSQFHDARAVTFTVILAAVAFLGVVVFRSTPHRGAASKGVRVALRKRGQRLAACLIAWSVIAVLLVPHLTIAWLSFADHQAWHTELVPTGLTLANYAEVFRDPGAWAPIRNSLWMSAVAALAAVAVAVPAAFLIGRKQRGGALMNVLVMIPWALPGTVIAMNLIIAFNDRWLPLYGTVWMLPLAYFVRGLPLLARISTAAIEPFDASLIEAGRTLGGSRWLCFRRIAAPMLAPAIGAGTALVFATSLGEFVSSILLYVPANIPISIQINMAWREAGLGAAFAYSVFLMVIVSATFVVARRFTSRML